ncbi:Translation initiation factor eIF-2B subunit gamma-like [Homarus americanus]|uniref:Translation initiation factor eIF2B subunit gamma n=1 Tax=Homarus americanus TaxID=6706 RepID=A0A8J5JZV8_HOMAM|nr:Translation initiation factor eIF-2B subunit gamma-like [Homarus americanus]
MHLEAQAIVLAAGPGMRMTTLTNHTPKCLLPVGTLPMVCYPLQILQEAGFSEVTVVVSGGEEQRMSKVVEQYGLKLNLDIAPVNTSHDPGTADSLRHIASKIKRSVDDVVIVTSDLVTDAKLQPIMDQHRSSGAALTMLTANQQPEFLKATPPGPKTKPTINNDVICTQSKTGRLMYAVAGGDYDEVISLHNRVMKSAKSLNVSTSTVDAHLYIMKRWLVDYILSKESLCGEMGSLKAEILPHIISRQFTKEPIKQRSERKLDPSFGQSFQMHSLFEQVYPNSAWSIKHPSADVQEKAQVSDDSLIGSGSVICEKTNITSSVIGNHCRINSFVRILNCALGDHITIAPGCVIENSLIAANVERKCTIKNCIVTDPNKIEENKTYTNEILEAVQDFA